MSVANPRKNKKDKQGVEKRRGSYALLLAVTMGLCLGPLSARAQLESSLILQNPDPGASDLFGTAVTTGDVNGDGIKDVIVGAPYADAEVQLSSGGSLPAPDAGRVWVFFGPDLTNTISLQSPMPEAGAVFGWTVASGDVNGDGVGDVIVGAPGTDVGVVSDGGQVFVFLGPELTTVFTLTDPQPKISAFFGDIVTSGDVNGDGVKDVIVGVEFAVRKTAVIFLGGSPFDTVADTILPRSAAAFPEASRPVASSDVNGDGVDDILISEVLTFGAIIIGVSQGRVVIFLGGDPLDAAPDLVLQAPPTFDIENAVHTDATPALPLQSPPTLTFNCNERMAAGGEVTGDGKTDVILADPCRSQPGVFQGGAAFVFVGPDFSSTLTLTASDAVSSDWFGSAVASGDVTGDGIEDVVVGALGAAVGEALDDAGKVYVFLGPELAQAITLSSPAPQVLAGMGAAIAVEDVNGDNIKDVIAGSPGADMNSVNTAGQVVVFFGG